MIRFVPLLLALELVPLTARAADGPDFTHKEDVIYGRKHGMALTFDVFTPKAKPNGLGVIFVVSGGWFSSHDAITPGFIDPLIRRGYTVFAVVHGSQPRFTIPEAIDDLHRAVRVIRHDAKNYKIDPERLGIYGLSAGGHLSLMQGVAALDSVSRTPSRVKAIAAFFPPTDFLNYAKPGDNAVGRGILHDFRAAFEFHQFDVIKKVYEPITDEARILEIGRRISPITHVSKDDPPTLIIQGDLDKLVPIRQAEIMVKKLKEAGVEAKLVVHNGGAHGWPEIGKDMELVADWFDAHLKS